MYRMIALLVSFAAVLAAQVDPDYVVPRNNPFNSPDDLGRGDKLFHGQCAGCHGQHGEGGKGAVLAQPKLRRAPDDETLFRVIRDGVKGTEMPAGDAMTTREIWQVAGFVRSLGQLPSEPIPGDARRGAEIYRGKGKCAQCHIVHGEGTGFGPDLSEIGARRSAAFLRESLIEPGASIPENYMQVHVTAEDGKKITGLRVHEDTFTIHVRDAGGRLYLFRKDRLKALQKDTDISAMPGFRQTLSDGELDDVVAYLATLRGEQ